MTDYEALVRATVVDIARYELEHSDHTAPKYWEGVGVRRPYPRHWCGAFALWCLRQTGLTDWSWVIGKGFAYRLKRTKNPQPGDVAYFTKLQHHAVVERVEGDKLWTIDGNQPNIKRRERKVSDVAAFFSISSLIKEPTDTSELIA